MPNGLFETVKGTATGFLGGLFRDEEEEERKRRARERKQREEFQKSLGRLFGKTKEKVGRGALEAGAFIQRGIPKPIQEGIRTSLGETKTLFARDPFREFTSQEKEIAERRFGKISKLFPKKKFEDLTEEEKKERGETLTELGIGFTGIAAVTKIGISSPLIKAASKRFRISESVLLDRIKTSTDPTFKAIRRQVGKLDLFENEFRRYQKQISDSIGKVNLPEFRLEEEFIPNTIEYQNPLTKLARVGWNKLTHLANQTPGVKKLTVQEGRPDDAFRLLKERNRIQNGLLQRFEEDIIAPIRKLPLEEKQQLGEMINKYTTPSPEFAPFVKKIDIEIGVLGRKITDINKKWVDNGWIRPEDSFLSEETFLNNLGKYARSFYLKKVGDKARFQPGVVSKEGRINLSPFKKKMTLTDWGKSALLHEGKTEAEITKLAPKELEAVGLEAKKAFGWVSQADAMLSQTFKDLTSNHAIMNYFDSVRSDPNLFSAIEKPGFVSVDNLLPRGVLRDRRLGPLNGGFIREGMEQDIRFFLQNGPSSVDKMVGGAISYWKGFKTGWSPATMGRNYVSGHFIQTDLAGFPVWNPTNTPDYFRAVSQYVRRGDRYKFWRDQGLFGGDYHAVEVDRSVLDKFLREGGDAYELANKIATPLDKIKAAPGKVARVPMKWYGSIDHMARQYLAEKSLQRGATPGQAVNFANKWQLDYRMVPEIVDKVRGGKVGGFIAPFLSFYYLMAPRILETAVTRPWTIMKYPLLAAGATTFAAKSLNMTKEEIESKKPSWMENSTWSVLMPWKDETGNPQWLDLSYSIPFGNNPFTLFIDPTDLFKLGQGGGPIQILQNVNNNFDPFFQRQIYDEEDPLNIRAKKVGAYALKGIGPGGIGHAMNLYSALAGEKVGWPLKVDRNIRQTLLRAIGISTYSGGTNEVLKKMNTLKKDINGFQGDITIEERKDNPDRAFITEREMQIHKRYDEISKLLNGVDDEDTRKIKSDVNALKVFGDVENIQLRANAEAIFEELKTLPKDEAARQFDLIDEDNEFLADKIKDLVEEDELGLSRFEKDVKSLGVANGARAEFIFNQLIQLSSAEADILFNDWVEKKLISDEVQEQINRLAKKVGRSFGEVEEDLFGEGLFDEGLFKVSKKRIKRNPFVEEGLFGEDLFGESLFR
jgi:hypothetical protein